MGKLRLHTVSTHKAEWLGLEMVRIELGPGLSALWLRDHKFKLTYAGLRQVAFRDSQDTARCVAQGLGSSAGLVLPPTPSLLLGSTAIRLHSNAGKSLVEAMRSSL